METQDSFEDVESLATDIIVRLTMLDDESSEKCSLLFRLSLLLGRQFETTLNEEYLEEAIIQSTEAIRTAPPGDPIKRDSSLALARMLRSQDMHITSKERDLSLPFLEVRCETPAKISERIERLSLALENIPSDIPELPSANMFMAEMLLKRSDRSNCDLDFKNATSLAKTTLRSFSLFDSSRQPYEEVYRQILVYGHIEKKHMDIGKAFELALAQAVLASSETHPLLLAVCDDVQSPEHLEEKISSFESYQEGYGYLKQFSQSGARHHLNRAIELFENSITKDVSDDILRAMLRISLSTAKFYGNELEEAIQLSEEAMKLMPEDAEFRIYVLFESSFIQYLVSEQNGDIEHLNKAIILLEEALNLTQKGPISRSALIYHLAKRLYDRSRKRGFVMEDLKSAQMRIEEAISLMSDDDDRLKSLMPWYVATLRNRYMRSGDVNFLDISLLKATRLKELSSQDSDLVHAYTMIGELFYFRYLRFNRKEDCREAATHFRKAIDMTPQQDQGFLRRLEAMMLKHQFDQTRDSNLIEEAIFTVRQAISSARQNHPSIPRLKETLGGFLYDRFLSVFDNFSTDPHEVEYNIELLDEAIECCEQALEAYPREFPSWGTCSLRLSGMLAARGAVQCSEETFRKFHEYMIDGLTHAPLPALSRIGGARTAIRQHMKEIPRATIEWKNMIATHLLSLVPDACSRELTREDQQFAVAAIQGLAADSCSLSLKLGNVEEALQKVESARGLILGYLIDRKDDLVELKERHADLASKYQGLRDRSFSKVESEKHDSSWESMMKIQKDAQSELGEVENEIRRIPGFENFLGRSSLEQLHESASNGPIVIVNVTDISSDAIILTPNEVVSIPLPKMSTEVPEHFQEALERYRAETERPYWVRDIAQPSEQAFGNIDFETRMLPGPSRNIRIHRKQSSNIERLTWLWDSCVFPILVRLKKLGMPSSTSGDLPHVWWIGSGAASSLPFHAAGDYEKLLRSEGDHGQASRDSSDTCMDWVSPSYTPSIKALKYARKRADKSILSESPSVLVVTMPSTPGQSALTGVLQEQAAVQETATGFHVENPLECPSVEEVLRRLPASPVVHFACHGLSDSINPEESHMLLQKKDPYGNALPDQLTVRAILDATTNQESPNWLVYLSACSTAEVKASKLSDENLHPASAFQVAGFAHAVGALWRTRDDICVEVARHFYKELSKYSGAERKFAVAHALRKAVIHIRRDHYREPSLWAPFIHFGA